MVLCLFKEIPLQVRGWFINSKINECKRDDNFYKLNTVVQLFITLIKNREKQSNNRIGQQHH